MSWGWVFASSSLISAGPAASPNRGPELFLFMKTEKLKPVKAWAVTIEGTVSAQYILDCRWAARQKKRELEHFIRTHDSEADIRVVRVLITPIEPK